MKAVAYYRVSTAEQGRSGLGLDAQRRAVADLCAARGLALLDEYTEVESGKRNDRPQLDAAISRAKLAGASLVVAKLDRLSRNAAFTLQLRDSGLDFICADQPDVNRMTIGILAVVNEAERDAISERTRNALREARERAKAGGLNKKGEPYKAGRLGNPNGAACLHRAGKGNKAAVEARKEAVDDRAKALAVEIERVRAGGAKSLREIADALNERGVEASRGGPWHPTGVKRLLERLSNLN